MSEHVNIENDEVTIPYYAIHEDGKIFGFFGPFRFLSNFYILENGICLDEVYYPSVEHAYQAAKWPRNLRDQFLDVTSGRAKKLGKEAPKFDARKWNKKKLEVMKELCRQKFINNLKLGEMLVMTEGCVLRETNNWGDTYWGCDENGNGENHLGELLMDIRHAIILERKGDTF